MQMTLTPWKHVIITAIASLSLATSCSDTTPERGPLANASLADTATMLGVGSTGAVGPGFLEGSMTVSAGEHHTCAIDSEGINAGGITNTAKQVSPNVLKILGWFQLETITHAPSTLKGLNAGEVTAWAKQMSPKA